MHRFIKIWAITAIGCAMSLTAQAQHARTVEKETAAETDTQSVILPSGPGSSLVIKCNDCPPLSLLATAATIYQLRDQPVTLAEFRDAIAARQANMTVIYNTKTRQVLRVKAAIDVAASKKR